jgi:hypothetical protein
MGGYLSDRLYDSYSLQGRLWIQFVVLLAQGAMNIWFAGTGDLGPSIIRMILFSILVQVRQVKSRQVTLWFIPYVLYEKQKQKIVVMCGTNPSLKFLTIVIHSLFY